MFYFYLSLFPKHSLSFHHFHYLSFVTYSFTETNPTLFTISGCAFFEVKSRFVRQSKTNTREMQMMKKRKEIETVEWDTSQLDS